MAHRHFDMTIPLNDLSRIHQPLEAELQAAFLRVLQTNSYILGPEVAAFERACAAYFQVPHVLGVSSGSDALLLALMVLNIGPGDEVICPSYTFFATAGAIARLGARPVFVDCEPDTYGWRLEQVFACATPRTRAVIPVHLFGQCAEMNGLMNWARDRNCYVIEDAAQALGAVGPLGKAGLVGDFGCFSFFPSKNLGGFGDGGLLVCRDGELAARARRLRSHGAEIKYHHTAVGGNFRLDALQAALLNVKLPHLEAWITQRREVAAAYLRRLAGFDLALPRELPDSRHTWNQFVIRLGDGASRERLRAHMQARGIATAIYYPRPLHLQPCFAAHARLPVAETAAACSLALPMFPGLSEAEIETICREIGLGLAS